MTFDTGILRNENSGLELWLTCTEVGGVEKIKRENRERVSGSPGCPLIHYVAKADLELLIFQPLPPKYWDYRHVHQVQLDHWGSYNRVCRG